MIPLVSLKVKASGEVTDLSPRIMCALALGEWGIVVCMLIPPSDRLSVTPWTVVPHQAPLSLGVPRQECWSGLPFPPPGYLPNPGIEPESSALAGGFFTTQPLGKPMGHG